MPGKETPQVANKTGAEHLDPWKWQPGQSGNPAGRPKSARSRLSEAFLKALADDFEANGMEAIIAGRDKDPNAYVRTVAALMPKVVEGSEDGPPVGVRHEFAWKSGE